MSALVEKEGGLVTICISAPDSSRVEVGGEGHGVVNNASAAKGGCETWAFTAEWLVGASWPDDGTLPSIGVTRNSAGSHPYLKYRSKDC